jgi:hypothetical protein
MVDSEVFLTIKLGEMARLNFSIKKVGKMAWKEK